MTVSTSFFQRSSASEGVTYPRRLYLPPYNFLTYAYFVVRYRTDYWNPNCIAKRIVMGKRTNKANL